MSQINVDGSDKDRFDDFKDSDQTQKEAFSEAMDIVQAFEGEVVDHEELANELKPYLGAACELGSYRGTKHYMEENDE